MDSSAASQLEIMVGKFVQIGEILQSKRVLYAEEIPCPVNRRRTMSTLRDDEEIDGHRQAANVPVERLLVAFASTPRSCRSPLQPGCYAAFFHR
jgi:hypothetical protein